jgi:hypothetical protein
MVAVHKRKPSLFIGYSAGNEFVTVTNSTIALNKKRACWIF